jgi:hypothetical protein
MAVGGHRLVGEGPEGIRAPADEAKQHAQPPKEFHDPPVADMALDPQFAVIGKAPAKPLGKTAAGRRGMGRNENLLAPHVETDGVGRAPVGEA